MIEVGKRYLIEARFKKRVTEVEFYKKNYDTILFDTLWRNGEFLIEPSTDDECKYIQKFIDLNEDSFEEFDLNTFYEMEMEGTFDECSTDFRGDITNEIKGNIENSELSIYEYLTENGWDCNDTKYYIVGPIDIC